MATEGSVKAFMYSLRCLPLPIARERCSLRGQSWMTTRRGVPALIPRNTPRPSSVKRDAADEIRVFLPGGRRSCSTARSAAPRSPRPRGPAAACLSASSGLGNQVDAHPAQVRGHGEPPFVIQILSSPWMASRVPKKRNYPTEAERSLPMATGLAVG